MNERVVRYMLRLATAGMVFVAVSGPAPAAAQSVEIWPGQNIQQIVNGWPCGHDLLFEGWRAPDADDHPAERRSVFR